MRAIAYLGLTVFLAFCGSSVMARPTPFGAAIDRSVATQCRQARPVFLLSRAWLAELIARHGAAARGRHIHVDITDNTVSVYDTSRVYRYRVVGNDRVEPIGHHFPAPGVMTVAATPGRSACG